MKRQWSLEAEFRVQPFTPDAQAGSSCAALAGAGRPAELRTDKSHDRSDTVQAPGTQVPVAEGTQGRLGRGQETGRWAGIFQQEHSAGG